MCESFWPVSQLSDKPTSVPQHKGFVAYRSMPRPPESLEERKGGGQSTLPKPGSAPHVPPLLVDLALVYSILSLPKNSGQSTEGPSRGRPRAFSFPTGPPSEVCRPRPVGQNLSARTNRLLAVQGANRKMPVMGPPSWLESPAWDRMVPLIPAGVSSSTPHPSLSGSWGVPRLQPWCCGVCIPPFGQPGVELKGGVFELPLHFRNLNLLT